MLTRNSEEFTVRLSELSCNFYKSGLGQQTHRAVDPMEKA